MVGNIYSKDGKRLLVEKQLSLEYVTCKQWFKGDVIKVSMTIKQLEDNHKLICTV